MPQVKVQTIGASSQIEGFRGILIARADETNLKCIGKTNLPDVLLKGDEEGKETVKTTAGFLAAHITRIENDALEHRYLKKAERG